MKNATARWTTAFAAFALLGLPAAGWPQPPPPTPSPSTTSQQPPSAARPEQHGAAKEHIRQAQTAVNDVQTASLQGKAKTKVTELKRHLDSLEQSTAGASTTASKTAARGKDNWSTEVSAIDKILTELLGPATTSAFDRPPRFQPEAAVPRGASLALAEGRMLGSSAARGLSRRRCLGPRSRRRRVCRRRSCRGRCTTAHPSAVAARPQTSPPRKPDARRTSPIDCGRVECHRVAPRLPAASGRNRRVAPGRQASPHRCARHARPVDAAFRCCPSAGRCPHAALAAHHEFQRADHHQRKLAQLL